MPPSYNFERSPRVSVIMPVFNAEAYLAEAVESILSQTFTDFELLAHDDGSTDGSLAILRAFEKKDLRVKISSSENQGIVPTLNALIDSAQAPLLARMDADDVCLPERFALQVAYLDEHPENIIVGGGSLVMDADGRIITQILPPTKHGEIDSNNLKGIVSLNHPTVMMRKGPVVKCGGYDPEFSSSQDLDLWLRLAEIGTVGNLSTIVLKYRIHGQSISGMNGQKQEALCKRACEAAWERRGTHHTFDYSPWRMENTRSSRRDFYIKYGWTGWGLGYRDTWRHYAFKSIKTDPLSLNAWKLLILGTLKRPLSKDVLLDE